MTKEEFRQQIIEGIKAGHLDPCNGVEFGELSDDEVKQAMLDTVDEYGVDDWYDQYQEA